MECYNTSCHAPTTGIASSTFASAVQFFAASQCLLTEGIYPEAEVKNLQKFDFIIVGAGTAGCVVARRLSEIKNWTILLIEAGGDPPIEADIPGLHPQLYEGNYSWNYRTTNNGIINQANINGSISWPRGKLIGGSSNVNAMVYVQGNDEDYQRWYDANNKEWSVKEVRRCFRKAENFQDMNLNKIPEVNKHYGHDGPLVINTFNETYRSSTLKILRAWDEIGINKVRDLNVAQGFGASIIRATAANGERYSVSKAYLRPVKNRENLKFMKNALVTKILIDSSKNAYGVIVEQNNKKLTIKATREVIICAGSINSPQLLMLSGVGPREHLSSVGIRTKVNLPHVGQNLRDHILLPVTIYTDQMSEVTEADLHFDVIKYFYAHTDSYLAQRSFYDILIQFSLNNSTKYPQFQVYCERYQRNDPQLKKILVGLRKYTDIVFDSIAELNKNHTMYIFQISLLHPYSTGNISLRSNNARDHPFLYPNYFSDPRDLETTVSGIEIVLNLLNTKYFKRHGGFLGRMKWPECDKLKLGSRDYFKCIIINLAGTVFHPIETCRMGSDSSDSVVSSRLKVHGVGNLRVIDASIMPNHISGNTNGPTVMVGERGAELVKEDYQKL